MTKNQKNLLLVSTFSWASLVLPILLNLNSDSFNWSLGDFIVMGFLLNTLYLAVFLIYKSPKPLKQKLILISLCCTVFFGIWAQLAVNIFFKLSQILTNLQ